MANELHELGFLYETCALLIKAQENEEVFSSVTEKICEFSGAIASSLWRINVHKDMGQQRIAFFQKNHRFKDQLPTYDYRIASLVIQEKRSYINESLKRILAQNKSEHDLLVTAFPLYVKGELIGVLNCWRSSGDPNAGRLDSIIPRIADELAHTVANAVEYSDIRRKRLKRELEIARKMQLSLTPKEVPAIQGISISARTLTAYEVGGDYVDIFATKGKNLGIAIGDVMGKGIPAALWASVVRATLRMAAREDNQPHIVIRDVNDTLSQDLSNQGTFITLLYAWYEPWKKTLLFSNAGHLNPLLIHTTSGLHQILKANGPYIGGIEKYQYNLGGVRLQAGDILFFYTDGLTETINPHNQKEAIKVIVDIIKKNAFYNANEIMDNLYLYLGQCMGDKLQHDDISCILLKIETE